MGFKQVVLLDDPRRGLVLGFLTKRFVMDRGNGPENLVSVYVPTNHIYFGDIHIYPDDVVSYPELSVQDGIQIFLTGGMALSTKLKARQTKPTRSESDQTVGRV